MHRNISTQHWDNIRHSAHLTAGALIFKTGQDAEWLGVIDLEMVEDEKGVVATNPSWSMHSEHLFPNAIISTHLQSHTCANAYSCTRTRRHEDL
jgi:hypothetical protein